LRKSYLSQQKAPKVGLRLTVLFITLQQRFLRAYHHRFGQIAVNIGFNCDIRFPEMFENVLSALAVVNIDIIPSLGMSCKLSSFDYTDKIFAVTLVPLFLGLILLMTSFLFINSRKRIIGILLALSFIVLVGVSTTLFHFFKCDLMALPDGTAEAYLFKDYSVDCSTSKYRTVSTFATIMIAVYPIGIPVSYFALLFKHRKILSDAKARAEEEAQGDTTVGHLKFLEASYKPA